MAAPSNTAIDIIVKNLVKFIPRREILRLVSVAKSTTIDEDIELVSTVEANDVIDRIKDGELKVLCGTLQILGKVPEAKVKATHIIIDEAGQATEGEILVVWPRMAKETGQLVLAGDPHQLGPVVLTKGAKYFGYDKSMMQRLIEFPLYVRKKGKFNEKYIIQNSIPFSV